VRTLLVRHLRPAIEPGTCYGRLDVPMHPDETAKADALTHDPALVGSARIWTSPAQRCRVLADKIAAALSAPLTADPRLLELDFGAWEGQAWDAIARSELDRWAADPLAFRAPGGESGAELIERVQAFHADVVRDGQDCVVVAHGGPLRVLNALLRREPVNLLAPAQAMGAIVSVG
jgi:alpha-ribazole phosphatase